MPVHAPMTTPTRDPVSTVGQTTVGGGVGGGVVGGGAVGGGAVWKGNAIESAKSPDPKHTGMVGGHL